MTNDKEAEWTKIRFGQSLDELAKHGPTIDISVGPANDGAARAAVKALIDTGAAGTAISPKLARLLDLEIVAQGECHLPGLQPIIAPYFRVRIFVPNGEIDLEVIGLATLDPPHDVLIGRDVLANSILQVDFMSGQTLWHLKRSV